MSHLVVNNFMHFVVMKELSLDHNSICKNKTHIPIPKSNNQISPVKKARNYLTFTRPLNFINISLKIGF